MKPLTGRVLAVPDDNEGYKLTPEEEDELYASLEEIRRGNYVDGRALLRELIDKRS